MPSPFSRAVDSIERVEVAVRVVVTQVQGGVCQVPEQVEIGKRVSRPEGDGLRGVQLAECRVTVSGDVVPGADQEVLEAPGAWGVAAASASTSMVSAGSLAPLSMPWLRATAAATAISNARTGSCTATSCGGLGEDPVRVRCRADIDRDAAPEPVDVREQHRVVGPLTGRRQQP